MSVIREFVGSALKDVFELALDAAGLAAVKLVAEKVVAGGSDSADGAALADALRVGQERAWTAIELSLVPQSLWQNFQNLFRKRADLEFRQQLEKLLDGPAAPALVAAVGGKLAFREKCLAELRQFRSQPSLEKEPLKAGIRDALERPHHEIQQSLEAADRLAEQLRRTHPHLGALVALRIPPAKAPLLTVALRHFTQQEIAKSPHLARLLAQRQQEHFASDLTALGEALDQHSDQLRRQLGSLREDLLKELRSIGSTVSDIRQDQQAHGQTLQTILDTVQKLEKQLRMGSGAMQPGQSFRAENEAEAAAVRQLLAQFRALPTDRQKQVPDLLNNLGKLAAAAGDVEEAREIFDAASREGPPALRAEALFNGYITALEQRDWPTALAHLKASAGLDPARFEPFPLATLVPERILGAGGFGAAFLCRHAHMQEQRVVKTLFPQELARPVGEVFSEARLLTDIRHPSVVRMLDCNYAGPNQARPYFVMEYFAESETLEQRVAAKGPLSLADALSVARSVAEAMHAVHERGVLHRDLKPANLLVRERSGRWEVKLIDFGLALRPGSLGGLGGAGSSAFRSKSLVARSLAGTPRYAAPEQLGELPGVPVGPTSDVFGFGRTLSYALFATTNLTHSHWLSLPRGVAELLDGCLQEQPTKRLASFAVVVGRLGELAGASTAAPATTSAPSAAPSAAQPTAESAPAKAAGSATKTVPPPDPTELAREYLADKSFAKAKTECDKQLRQAAQLSPSQVAALRAVRGQAQLGAKNLTGAAEDAELAIAADPRCGEAFHLRGLLAVARSDSDTALADFAVAVQLDPKLADAFAQRGQLYWARGDLAAAAADFGDVIRLDPKNAEALTARAAVREAAGDFPAALDDANAAIQHGEAAEPYRIKARLLERRNHIGHAIAALNNALKIDDKSAADYLHRGRLREANGEREDAMADYDKAVQYADKEQTEPLERRAALHLLLGNANTAKKDAKKAVERNPSSVRALQLLAEVFEKDDELTEARAKLDRAVELAAGDAGLRRQRAGLLARLAQADPAQRSLLEAAVADAAEAARLEAAVGREELATISLHGRLLLEAGATESALAELDRAARLEPTGESLFRRGQALLQAGRADEAVADFVTAINAKRFRQPEIYIARSAAYEAIGQNGRAENDLKTAVELSQSEPARQAVIVCRLGDYYFRRNMHIAAEEQYARAAGLAKNCRDVKLGRAQLAVEKPILDDARTLLSKLLDTDPTCARAYLLHARVQAKSNNDAAALRDYGEALRLDPSLDDAWVGRAERHLARGDRPAALADLTEALRRRPGRRELWVRRAELRAATDPAGALTDYDRALALEPANVELLRTRGELRLTGGDAAGAVADFQAVLAGGGSDGAVYARLAEALLARGDVSQAASHAARACRLSPEAADARTVSARCHLAAGDAAAAIADCDRILASAPDNHAARLLRGEARLAAKSIANAQADFDAVLSARPDWTPALAARAQSFVDNGLPLRAVADLTAAIAAEPTRSEWRLRRAEAFHRAERAVEAVNDLDAVLSGPPGQPSAQARALTLRATLRNQKAEYAAAARDAEAAVALQPDNVQAWTQLGRARHQQKDAAGALAALGSAIAADARATDARMMRAKLLISQGDHQAVIADMDAVLAVSPTALAYVLRGKAHLEKRPPDCALAIHDFSAALALSPEYKDALAGRSIARKKSGDLSGAAADVALLQRLQEKSS